LFRIVQPVGIYLERARAPSEEVGCVLEIRVRHLGVEFGDTFDGKRSASPPVLRLTPELLELFHAVAFRLEAMLLGIAKLLKQVFQLRRGSHAVYPRRSMLALLVEGTLNRPERATEVIAVHPPGR